MGTSAADAWAVTSDAGAEPTSQTGQMVDGDFARSEMSAGQKWKTKRMGDYVVVSTFWTGSEISRSMSELKMKLLFLCLDRMISELRRRFSGVNLEFLGGLQACSPTSDHFLSEPHLTALATHYCVNLMSEELIVAKNLLKLKREAGAVVQNILKCSLH